MIRTIKPFFGIFITILLFYNCSSDNLKNRNIPINSLGEMDSILSPNIENFEIVIGEETILKGKKGTSIYIPANTFQFKDGTEPKEPINIEIKECYSLSSMIFENLQTISGDRILETNGMIYINAEANGRKLSIKNNKAIVIGFPKNDLEKEMDLFYDFQVNDSTKTWVPDYKMFETTAIIPEETTENELDSLGIGEEALYEVEYPIEMTEDLYDYRFWNSGGTGTFYYLKLKGSDETILDFINTPSNIDSAIAHKFYKNNWSANLEFNIDKNGVMRNFRPNNFLGTKYNSEALKIAEDFLKSAPVFDLDSYDEQIRNDWDFSLSISGTRTLNQNRFKKRFREKYSKYTNSSIQKIDPSALEYYMFAATEMGWINCDIFWDIAEDEKTDFVVDNKQSADMKIQIIFKDIKSILSGTLENGKLVFKNVPLGKEIKVIGISFANGKPTLAVAETIINEKPFELSGFKEFTLDELEVELNKLN